VSAEERPRFGPFALQRRADEGGHAVTARGELDAATAPALGRALTEAVGAGGGPVLADLTGLTFVDSSGLGVLMKTANQLRRQRRAFTVRCVPGPVLRTIQATGLEAALDIERVPG
jgi:anti-anti-sigma factor